MARLGRSYTRPIVVRTPLAPAVRPQPIVVSSSSRRYRRGQTPLVLKPFVPAVISTATPQPIVITSTSRRYKRGQTNLVIRPLPSSFILTTLSPIVITSKSNNLRYRRAQPVILIRPSLTPAPFVLPIIITSTSLRYRHLHTNTLTSNTLEHLPGPASSRQPIWPTAGYSSSASEWPWNILDTTQN